MNYNWDIIGDKVFGILRGRGYRLQMFDKTGNKTMDPHEATRFFATVPSQATSLKNFNILLSLHNEDSSSHLDIKTPTLENDGDFNTIINLKKSIENNVGDAEGLSINWYKFDHDIDPREDAVHNVEESKTFAESAAQQAAIAIAMKKAGKKPKSIAEDSNKCPPATQDITLNLKNRQKAIDEYGYGPLNPDLPNNKFWMKKVDEWNLDSTNEAKQSLCGNCAAFDQRTETLDCIAKGIDSDNPADAAATIDAGDLGYCKFLKFKCASRRTCDAWVTGGPLVDSKQVNESKDISKPYGSTKSSYQQIGNSKLIIRHTDPVDESKQGSRWRRIRNIFIETKLGERFAYPHPHIAGARAMARHLANDGRLNDDVGGAILRMSEDYINLKKANKMLRHAGDDRSLTVKDAIRKLSKDSKRLSGNRGYGIGIADLNQLSEVNQQAYIDLANDLIEHCGCSHNDTDAVSAMNTAAKYIIMTPAGMVDDPVDLDYTDDGNDDIDIVRLSELAGLMSQDD